MPNNKRKKESRGKEGGFPGLVLWLIFFLILLGGALYVVIGQSRIKQVVVSGSLHYSNEEVMAMAGIDKETTVLDLLMGRNEKQEGLPYIKDIEVDYLSFNSVHITVTEKEVISYIPYQDRYLALDKDGYIVGYEQEKVIDRPSVEGLYFQSASLGEALDVSDQVLLALLDFYHLGIKYQVPLDELDFTRGDAGMIVGRSGQVSVVFGDTLDLDRKMKDAAEVLKRLDRSVAGTLDLQVSAESYIFKETMGIDYYIAYGERYVGVAFDRVIKKISTHKLKERPLVRGLRLMEPEVGMTVPLDEEILDRIDLMLETAADLGMPVAELDFEKNIKMTCGEVVMDFGKGDDLVLRIQAAADLFLTLEKGAKGSVDLRKEQENYSFEASESP